MKPNWNKKIEEMERKMRAFAYRNAPNHVKRQRREAFMKAITNPHLWAVEPREYRPDQPD